jgi:hypothetical protein
MSKFAQYLTESEGIKIFCSMIQAQRQSGSKTSSVTFTVPDSKSTDLLAVFDEHNCQPNASMKDIKAILAKVKAGEIWVGDDVYGEGILAFGPPEKEAEVKKAASKEYKTAYAYNGPGR